MAIQHDSEAGRGWRRHLGIRVLGDEWKRGCLDADYGRRGSRAGVPAGRNAYVRLLRRASTREQPVRGEHRLRRPEDRPAQMALPVRASPDLEFRHVVGTDHRGCHGGRKAPEGGGGPDQAGVALRVRSRYGRANLAHRREAGAAVGCPGRKDVADAAASARQAAVRAQLRQGAG